MIKGLGGASIWSEDLTKLLPFYRDTLGMAVALDTPGFVVLGTDVTQPALALGTHSEVHGKAKEPQRHIVSLTTDDIKSEHKRLSSAGVAFLEEPTDGGQVIFATFTDPEGNYLQLLEFKG
jgi:predicted enzyme related to lactoylglutathione lyase